MTYYSCLFLVLGTKSRDSDMLGRSSSRGATSSNMGLLKEFKVKFMFNSQQRSTLGMCLPCVHHVCGVVLAGSS